LKGQMVRYSLPGIGILTLAVVGTLTHNVPTLYASIIAICLVVTLVAFGKIGEGYFPYLLYCIGLGMVFMFTLAGPHLQGPDVHLQYYFAQLYSGGEVWPPIRPTTPEAGIGATIIAPYLLKIFQIPLLYTFKVVYPILFAFVPVVLYSIFIRWINGREAFLASFLFIAFPSFLIEMPGIPEGMVAELLLILTIFLIIASNLRLKYKIPPIIICGLLTSFIHYSVGVILIILLIIGFFIQLRIKGRMPTWAFGSCLIIILIGSSLFFATTVEGALARQLSLLYNSFVPEQIEVKLKEIPEFTEVPRPKEFVKPTPIPEKEAPKLPPLPERYEPLMQTALGLDFLEVPTSGQFFRVLQWILVLLIPIGLVRLRRNKEYWIFTIGTIILIGLCLIPEFSSILNATRFFHFSLIMLAPASIIGGILIFRKPQIFTLCILIPYFLFTSGFIFEVTKQEDISRINIPYNIALSDHRVDLGATITENDLEVADWIVEDAAFPLYSDLHASCLIGEKIGSRAEISDTFHRYENLMLPPPYYVFIRERNVWDGKVNVWSGIGCREFFPIEKYGININENIIYQVGGARVLEVK